MWEVSDGGGMWIFWGNRKLEEGAIVKCKGSHEFATSGGCNFFPFKCRTAIQNTQFKFIVTSSTCQMLCKPSSYNCKRQNNKKKQSQPNANQHVCKKISNELTPVFSGLPYCSLRQSYSIAEGAIESPIRPIIWLQRRLLKPNVTRLPHRISISRGTSEHWGKYAKMEIVSAPGLERSTVKAKDQN